MGITTSNVHSLPITRAYAVLSAMTVDSSGNIELQSHYNRINSGATAQTLTFSNLKHDIGLDVLPYGNIFNIDYDSAETLTGDLCLFNSDLETNLTQGTHAIYLTNFLTDNSSFAIKSPGSAGGTIIDIGADVLPTGTVIDFSFDSTETLTGTLEGISLDLATNVTHGSQSIKGIVIDLAPTDHSEGPLGLLLKDAGSSRFAIANVPSVDGIVRFVTYISDTQKRLALERYPLQFDGTNVADVVGNAKVLSETPGVGGFSGTAAAGGTEGDVVIDEQDEEFDVALQVPSDAIDSGVANDWKIGLDAQATTADQTIQVTVWDHQGNILLSTESLTIASASRSVVYSTGFGDAASLTKGNHLVVRVDQEGAGPNAVTIYGIVLQYPRGIQNEA